MRIGILTFHRALNYGAVLQAYVLSSYLRDLGYDAEIIDFVPKGHMEKTERFVSVKGINTLKYNLTTMRHIRYLDRRDHDFHAFSSQYLHLSREREITAEELERVVSGFDAIICGSDQIWNPDLADADITFFLPFRTDSLKIAYGISIGGGFLGDYREPLKIREAIQQFDYLSFREDSAVKKLLQFCRPESMPEIVADPVMLYGRKEFEKIAGEKQIHEPYVFLYTSAGSVEVIKAAEKLSREKKLPYYTLLAGKQKSYWNKIGNHIPPGDLSPRGFLAMIRDAECVVTDSFHGALFSILFQKDVYIIKRKNEKGMIILDDRLIHLTKMFHLEYRYIQEDEIIQDKIKDMPDQKTVEEIRRKSVESSKKYLEKALKHAETEKTDRHTHFEHGMICPTDLCTGCFACRNKCPRDAIILNKTDDGRMLPAIDSSLCIQCYACVNVCPSNHPTFLHDVKKVYAAQWKNSEEAMKSSTSGIASLISRDFVIHGGYVYGAGIGEDLAVRHYGTNIPEELAGMRTSKYAQSDVGLLYREIRQRLSAGERILFTGTPCQIAALKNFLGEDPDNLYCIDTICHGTPPMSYLFEHLKTLPGDFDSYSFRGGNTDKMMTLKNKEKVISSVPWWEDKYYFGFTKDMTLAVNCYSCPYTCTQRGGDMTLGDFWKINRNTLKVPMKGRIALVLVNTVKGAELWENIGEEVIFEERILDDAYSGNPNLQMPTKPSGLRKSYIKNYRIYGDFEEAFNRSSASKAFRNEKIKRTKAGKFLLKIKRLVKKN